MPAAQKSRRKAKTKAKKRKPVKKRKRGSSKVHSVLIDKDYFTKKEEIEWLKMHKFKHNKIDITKRYYRFRQFTPKKTKEHRLLSQSTKKE